MSKRHVINRFLSVWEIMFLVAIVGIVSVLLFPKKEILSVILKNQGYVSPEYIKALIRVDPNKSLKIALAKNYMKAGQYRSAEEIMDGLRFSPGQLYFIDYIALKYRMLKAQYYTAKSSGDKKIIKNKINASLSLLMQVNRGEFSRYISDKGKEKAAWMLDGYKFAYYMGNYKLALNLLQKYLYAYPEYNIKYYKAMTILYIITGENQNAYETLYAYIRTRKNYDKKAALFDTVIEKSILEKNLKLTMLLLKIYKKDFPNDLKIKKLILTYALQSGDIYFARNIAVELSGENQ